jgi:hypothetical protein
MSADYDSPWKEALDLYFRPFLAFFLRAIHDDIDWSRGYEVLDKELQRIAPRSARGRLYVDKLVKVWLKNGREVWILLHIEIQTQRQRGFPRRLSVYNHRISDHYNRRVVSVAVLADDDPKWRPDRYEDEFWGWSERMVFPVVKLLDYRDREAELEADANPFARVVLAHLKALETRGDAEARWLWKFRLARGLHEYGFATEDVRQLLRLIDWLMVLPEAAQKRFRHELDEYEEARKMPYVTTFERDGMVKMIESVLRTKFGNEGAALVPTIRKLNDAEKYLTINEAIAMATTLEEVRQACAEAAAPSPRLKGKKRINGRTG